MRCLHLKFTGMFTFFLLNLGVDAQFLSTSEENYLISESVKVNSEPVPDKWQEVLERIGNKDMLMLGEFTHGAREINLSRNSLIKALHIKKGFEVIIFEAGIGEMAFLDLNRQNLNAGELLNGFFANWRSREFIELMKFVKKEKLSIAGFDVQRSGSGFDQLLSKTGKRLQLDSIYHTGLEKRYGAIRNKLNNRDANITALEEETNKLISDYSRALGAVQNDINPTDTAALYVCRTLHNRMEYLKYMLSFVKTGDWHARWEARDKAMAANVKWLKENIYADKKLIVIGHNFHISRYNESEQVMGEFLKQEYGNEIYTIGVFAGSGSYRNNSGKVEKMTAPDKLRLDIKHIIGKLPDQVHFLEVPSRRSKSSKWLFEKILVNDSFIDLNGSKEMVLAQHFDGLIFIDVVSPAATD